MSGVRQLGKAQGWELVALNRRSSLSRRSSDVEKRVCLSLTQPPCWAEQAPYVRIFLLRSGCEGLLCSRAIYREQPYRNKEPAGEARHFQRIGHDFPKIGTRIFFSAFDQ